MFSRNVILLGISQILALTGATIVFFTGTILGTEMAPIPTLATLSNAILVVGVAIFTIPASMMMSRYGRRFGFMASALMACLGAIGALIAIWQDNFFLFCAMMLLIGGNNAFAQQYRFAAAESVSEAQVSRAISTVLLAGVIGGFLGPQIARLTKDLLPYGEYTGSYAVLAVIYLLVMLTLAFLPSIRAQEEKFIGPERPLSAILVQPRYMIAVLSGVVAYGVMSLLMTATPISMHTIHGHSLEATALVIQSHVVAMYLPSLFTGSLIARLGTSRVMGMGILAMFTCVVIDLVGSHIYNYWTALVLLGVGWNFLFVGGTVLLTQSYFPPERFKAQGFNDFTVFGAQALASLSAGALVFSTSWRTINLIAIPLLFMVLVAVLFVSRYPVRTVIPESGQVQPTGSQD